MTVVIGTVDALTVAAAFFGTAVSVPLHPFLLVLPETAHVYGIASGYLSYRDAASEVARLRELYAAAGYGPGHHIGLMVENRPVFFLHWLALNDLGAGVVPLNPDLRPAELEYIVRHSEIVLIVAATAHLEVLRSVTPDVPAIADDASPLAAPWPKLQTIPGLETECALLYTSGTTGRPKGCVLSNDYFLRAGHWYATVGGLCALREGDRLITPLPLTHMNAMAFSTMAMIVIGGCIVQLDRFHPRSRSGENISAVEVESVLRRDPRIGDVAVAAVPDEIREEEGAGMYRAAGADR
jgi:acyl-CoA synthetase (AMP-forming)/AMP-acid ligase II